MRVRRPVTPPEPYQLSTAEAAVFVSVESASKLDEIARAVALVAAADRLLRTTVDNARRDKWGAYTARYRWADIAAALNVTPQAASKRFGGDGRRA